MKEKLILLPTYTSAENKGKTTLRQLFVSSIFLQASNLIKLNTVNELTSTTGLLHIPSAKVHCTAGVSELGIKHESHFSINYLVV